MSLTQQWGILKDGEEYPYSFGGWDEQRAKDAAEYNNSRWGNHWTVVSRWVSNWSQQTSWAVNMQSMLGKQVRVTLNREDPVVVNEGVLLQFTEDGEVAIRDEDGIIRWGWPNLETVPV